MSHTHPAGTFTRRIPGVNAPSSTPTSTLTGAAAGTVVLDAAPAEPAAPTAPLSCECKHGKAMNFGHQPNCTLIAAHVRAMTHRTAATPSNTEGEQ